MRRPERRQWCRAASGAQAWSAAKGCGATRQGLWLQWVARASGERGRRTKSMVASRDAAAPRREFHAGGESNQFRGRDIGRTKFRVCVDLLLCFCRRRPVFILPQSCLATEMATDAVRDSVVRRLLASLIPMPSMKKMKRAAQLSDDRTSCRGSNSACALARMRCRWARRSCTTTS